MKKDFLLPGTYFHFDNKPVALNNGRKAALDFWKWAYSDLMQNTTRGIVAQYIVAWALGVDYEPNDPWRSYDILAPNGKHVEVKSTAHLQVWSHGENNRRHLFVIKPTLPYTPENGLGKKKKYNADIYVLCYFHELVMGKADPMNLAQWKFWVFSKDEIIKLLDGKKSITVEGLEKKGYEGLQVNQLKGAIVGIK